MTVEKFEQLANSEQHKPPENIKDNPEELERKFWCVACKSYVEAME